MYKKEFIVFNQNYNSFIKDNSFGQNQEQDESKFKGAQSLITGIFKEDFSNVLDEFSITNKLIEGSRFVDQRLSEQDSVDMFLEQHKIATIDNLGNIKKSDISNIKKIVSEKLGIKKENKFFNLICLFLSEKKHFKMMILWDHFSK